MRLANFLFCGAPAFFSPWPVFEGDCTALDVAEEDQPATCFKTSGPVTVYGDATGAQGALAEAPYDHGRLKMEGLIAITEVDVYRSNDLPVPEGSGAYSSSGTVSGNMSPRGNIQPGDGGLTPASVIGITVAVLAMALLTLFIVRRRMRGRHYAQGGAFYKPRHHDTTFEEDEEEDLALTDIDADADFAPFPDVDRTIDDETLASAPLVVQNDRGAVAEDSRREKRVSRFSRWRNNRDASRNERKKPPPVDPPSTCSNLSDVEIESARRFYVDDADDSVFGCADRDIEVRPWRSDRSRGSMGSYYH